jgi:short-subunit dehydrogenase
MVRDGRGGCIINMASQAGRRGEAASAIYAAIKAAVISLTQSAALALIKDRIRVNAIAPGVIDTEMWDRVDALYSRQFGLPLGVKKREVGLAVPYGRMGHPCEVASAAVFLASTEAEYIVGQTLNVDGGNVLSSNQSSSAFRNAVAKPGSKSTRPCQLKISPHPLSPALVIQNAGNISLFKVSRSEAVSCAFF